MSQRTSPHFVILYLLFCDSEYQQNVVFHHLINELPKTWILLEKKNENRTHCAVWLNKTNKTKTKTCVILAYQHRGHWVFIIVVQVTVGVVRNHDTSRLAVHPKMRVCVADKHQQSHRVIPPSYFVLWGDGNGHSNKGAEWTRGGGPAGVPHPANGRLHDGVEATLGQVDVGRHALLRDDLVELVSVARQRQHVFVSKRGQTGDVWGDTAGKNKQTPKGESKGHQRHRRGVAYLQGFARSSSVILMNGRVGFSTNDPKPMRNLLVRLAISLERVDPKSLIFCRSSTMEADKSIR